MCVCGLSGKQQKLSSILRDEKSRFAFSQIAGKSLEEKQVPIIPKSQLTHLKNEKMLYIHFCCDGDDDVIGKNK